MQESENSHELSAVQTSQYRGKNVEESTSQTLSNAPQNERHSEREKLIQFNWRKHWKSKVKPYLDNPLVQLALDMGMSALKPDWQSGDAPYLLGHDGPAFAKPGTLAWYRPYGRCHYIAFFSMAIGVINYPDLEWKIISGRAHTVSVGYDNEGQPRVVMDILWSHANTAEESIARTVLPHERDPGTGWHRLVRWAESDLASAIREALAQNEAATPEYYGCTILDLMAKAMGIDVPTLIQKTMQRLNQETRQPMDDADVKDRLSTA
jgi:hypothetical protein